MSHTITGKLNKAARQHQNSAGVTFFVSLGEQNYNHQTKTKEWTNYDAALFAKDGQIQFYNDNLVEGAIVSVTGKGLIVEQSEQYGPKLKLVDAQLSYCHNPGGQAPQKAAPQYAPQQQAPQQMAPQQQQAPTLAQQAAQHPQAQPVQQQPHNGFQGQPIDDSGIPF